MKQKRSDQLREAIEEEIVMGRFPPGSRIDDTALALRFGVSRTPIREALIQLASSGLVEIRRRRGALVSEINPHRLYEMFEVMAELEAMCARRAARRGTEAQQRVLLSALALTRRAAETRDVDAYFHENEGFHQAIYAASQNAFLIEQTLSVQRRLRPYRRLQLRVRDRMSNSLAEHEAITAAIIAGDADLAAEHIRGHIVIQGERFGDLVASLAQWRAGAQSANEELPAKARARAVG
jgi:DNA-binding GntR family transcriptional regulator